MKISYIVGLLQNVFPEKRWPGQVGQWAIKVFQEEGLWCHTVEGAASVTPKWLSLRLVLEAYMLEFGG